MVQTNALHEDEGWVEAILAFIASPPKGTPDALLAQLADAVAGSHTSLPPRVFYEAVQQSAIAISITDPQAKILYANPAFTEITGYTLADVYGQNESILSDKRTPIHLYKEMWQALVDKNAWSGELINRRKNGECYLASLTIAPVVGAENEISHYLGIHRDISKQYRLSQKVKNQKNLIESVVDAAPVVMALLDEQGNVVQANQAYHKLDNEMVGSEPIKELWNDLLECDCCGTSTEKEIRFDPGGGRPARWFSCSCTKLEETDTSVDAFFETRTQNYCLLVAKEITDIKNEQESVRMNSLRALMAEEELVQSVRETLAGAVYQLQGPLNMVAAASNLIERKGKSVNLDGLRRVLRDAIGAGAHAMDTLSNCMPEIPSDAPGRINVNELLHEVLSLSTKPLLSAGVIVDWKPTAVLPPIVGREHSLRAMFKQLIDNAIDAMNDRACLNRDLSIRTALTEDGFIQVFIDDSGPGIDEKDRINVFQPFFSTKGVKGKRAGMGLTMVQDTVTQHAGIINISRSPEGGCRIELLLPLNVDSVGGDV